jgi:hypothetical protein
MTWTTEPPNKTRIFFGSDTVPYNSFRVGEKLKIHKYDYKVTCKRKGYVYFTRWMYGEVITAQLLNSYTSDNLMIQKP